MVALNRFPSDTRAEIDCVKEECEKLGVKVCLSNVWAEGGKGAEALAKEVVRLCEASPAGEESFRFAYPDELTTEEKIDVIAKKVYGGKGVAFTPNAKKQAEKLRELGFGDLPVCIAKTQYSFSDDPQKLGAPENFEVTVRNLKVSAGAGFIVALTGVSDDAGAPKIPAAERSTSTKTAKSQGCFNGNIRAAFAKKICGNRLRQHKSFT